MSFEALLTETGDVKRFTGTGTDAHGHATGSWATSTASVPCRKVNISATENTGNADVNINNIYFLMGPSVSITAKDRFYSGSVTYEVLGVMNQHGHHLKCLMRKVS